MQDSAKPFDELTLAATPGVTLTGIESIDGSDAYAIKSGKTTYYYDVKSGLKVAQAKEQEQNGQKMTMMTNFKDYREVKGVKVPYNVIQNVGFELDIKLDSVKINEGITDADFQ